MKNILTILAILFTFSLSAQKKAPQYEKVGTLVKATYFYDNGSVKEQGYFKNKKLTGEWVKFDEKGNKNTIAYYNEGKKVGKWLIWKNDTSITQISYENNTIANVTVKTDASTRLAFRN